MGEADGNSIDDLEEMLFHFDKIFHPNHYILVDIMHNLVHLYAARTASPSSPSASRAPGGSSSSSALSRPEKERKVQLCLHVLDVLGRVDPGFTKWRGTLLQELIHPLMMVSKEDHAAGRITDRRRECYYLQCGCAIAFLSWLIHFLSLEGFTQECSLFTR